MIIYNRTCSSSCPTGAVSGVVAIQRIEYWAAEIGLQQYAQRVDENDINFIIFPDLSDQDLKELRGSFAWQ